MCDSNDECACREGFGEGNGASHVGWSCAHVETEEGRGRKRWRGRGRARRPDGMRDQERGRGR